MRNTRVWITSLCLIAVLLVGSLGLSYAQATSGKNLFEAIEQAKTGNYKGVESMFLRCAHLGYDRAFLELAYLYHYGKGVEVNRKEALKWLKKTSASALANPKADFLLAFYYDNGWATEINQEKASFIYENAVKLAEESELYFLYQLAGEMMHGFGEVREDPERAKYILEVISRSGLPDASLLLGKHYFSGRFYDKDYKKAFKYFQTAAKGEEILQSEPRLWIAWCYEHGLGVEKDVEQAEKLYSIAQEKEHNIDLCNFATALMNGSDGLKRNRARAADLYRRAAENKMPEAVLAYAICNEKGNGVPADGKKALELYHLALDLGTEIAPYHLGRMYRDGIGTSVDFKKAIHYYKMAAERGYQNTYYQMALLFHRRSDSPDNMKKALELYEKAAEGGNANAFTALGEFYFLGKQVKQDFAKAKEYFTEAANMGEPRAQYNLGVMYYKGMGVKQDNEKAIAWWQRAAELKYMKADKALDKIFAEMK